jgi:hypothetical protein
MYDDNYGIQTSYVSFWQELAYYFKAYDSVLAYELFNEPVKLEFSFS